MRGQGRYADEVRRLMLGRRLPVPGYLRSDGAEMGLRWVRNQHHHRLPVRHRGCRSHGYTRPGPEHRDDAECEHLNSREDRRFG